MSNPADIKFKLSTFSSMPVEIVEDADPNTIYLLPHNWQVGLLEAIHKGEEREFAKQCVVIKNISVEDEL